MNEISFVAELASDLFGPNKYDVTRITHGEVNRVYIVEEGKAKLIFRLNEPGEIKRFQKEQWCMEQASQRDILTPHILKVGSSKGVSYMVTNFIEGAGGNDIPIPDRQRIWHKLGKYAARFADIKVNGFGDSMIREGAFSDSWSRFLGYNTDSLDSKDPLLKEGLITNKQQAQLKSLFAALRDQPFEIGLCHGDLSLDNVIVDQNQDIFLLDWGCAEAHFVPYGELIGVLENGGGDTGLEPSNEDFQTFARGYGLTNTALRAIWDQLLSLWLLRRTDKLRWAIDRKPILTQNYAAQLQAVLNQVS